MGRRAGRPRRRRSRTPPQSHRSTGGRPTRSPIRSIQPSHSPRSKWWVLEHRRDHCRITRPPLAAVSPHSQTKGAHHAALTQAALPKHAPTQGRADGRCGLLLRLHTAPMRKPVDHGRPGDVGAVQVTKAGAQSRAGGSAHRNGGERAPGRACEAPRRPTPRSCSGTRRREGRLPQDGRCGPRVEASERSAPAVRPQAKA